METAFQEKMASQVEPHWARGKISRFTGSKGLSIRYGYFQSQAIEKGTLVLLPGQGEWMEKYAELVYDFNSEGYSVAILDHRGQGASDREYPKKRTSHVECFDDFVEDVHIFVLEELAPNSQKPFYLFGHSMGGAIAVGYLEAHPGIFKKVILNAPMLGIKAPVINDAVSSSVAQVLGRLPLIQHLRAPGARPFAKPEDFLRSETTHCKERFKYSLDYLEKHPHLAIDPAGATFRFGKEAYQFVHKIMSDHLIRKVNVPALLFQAPGDTFVDNKAQEQFAKTAPDCQLLPLDHPRFQPFHELFFEVDEIRQRVLEKSLEFLNDAP